MPRDTNVLISEDDFTRLMLVNAEHNFDDSFEYDTQELNSILAEFGY